MIWETKWIEGAHLIFDPFPHLSLSLSLCTYIYIYIYRRHHSAAPCRAALHDFLDDDLQVTRASAYSTLEASHSTRPTIADLDLTARRYTCYAWQTNPIFRTIQDNSCRAKEKDLILKSLEHQSDTGRRCSQLCLSSLRSRWRQSSMSCAKNCARKTNGGKCANEAHAYCYDVRVQCDVFRK